MKNNWLDKYSDDVPQAQNGIEGTMGGLTDKGFNYNGAWGGQFEDGGLIPNAQKGKKVKPIYVESENDPRYRAYQDSLTAYNYGEKEYTKFLKDRNEHNRYIKEKITTQRPSVDKKDVERLKQTPFPIYENSLAQDRRWAAGRENLKAAQQNKGKLLRITNNKPISVNSIKYTDIKQNDPGVLDILGRIVGVETKADKERSDDGAMYLGNSSYSRYKKPQQQVIVKPTTTKPSTKSKPITKPQQKEVNVKPQLQPRVEALNIQPVQQAPINLPFQEIDTRPRFVEPKSFNIRSQRQTMSGPSDYYNYTKEGATEEEIMRAIEAAKAYNADIERRYGNEEALKNPKAVERLKQLRQDVEVTPVYQMGGYVYPVNYVPKAQDGFTSFMSNLGDNIVEFFSDEEEEKIKPIKKTPVKKSGNKDNTRTLNIVDPRKKLATTNQPLRPNSDLVGGKYSSKHLDRLIQEAKRQGMSKQDIMNLSAMGFQETKWGKTDGNIGHVMGDWGGDDDYQLFINAYNAKMKEADRLGVTDPAMRLQVYNGLGTITPSTEKDYHGFEMQKIYGVPIPKGGISMKKNPLYGKQVMDIRDNVLAKNPEYIKYMDSIYKAPVPNAKYNIVPGPKMHQKSKIEKEKLAPLKKKAMGGSIPGSVGFTYARTKGIPSEGPYAKKTMPSAQNGQEMKYYQEGLDFRPKTISRDGSVIKDDMGQWAHPGEITEINSNDITMQGVPYPVLGISDTGDTKLMQPGKDYKFKGKKVTEFPMAKNGLRQEQKGLVNLDQLTNFTNYNKPTVGGWLDKY